MCGVGYIWEISIPSLQLCCEPKTSIKKKSIKSVVVLYIVYLTYLKPCLKSIFLFSNSETVTCLSELTILTAPVLHSSYLFPRVSTVRMMIETSQAICVMSKHELGIKTSCIKTGALT